MKQINLIFILMCVAMMACNNNKSGKELDMNQMLVEESSENVSDSTDDNLNEIIQSIPSPLELAAVIRSTGVEFNDGLMNPDKNKDKYASSYDKAFNLGVYGGDLGYINMYEKSYLALNYLGAIKKLADDLKVGHFFDFNTIKRLASNSNKLDSLLYISTSSLNRMDDYLRSQKRGHLSALIISGSWLEGLYIATEIAITNPSDELVERIGEQKLVLEQIMYILSVYENDAYFAELASQYGRIRNIYKDVTITYYDQEPETTEVDGRLVITDNSYTEVNITMEQLDLIRTVVSETRNKMTAH
ncbi:MAG: hypothetical protein GY790_10545 [Bacteroidetes bacterium]|nr:hypothetical protein [Bacteroidota bacterium]